MKWRNVCKVVRIFILISMALPARAEEQVTLQLKWRHSFQFAGYYAAVQQGFYAKAGLSVTILEAAPGVDPVAEVLSGNAQYGTGTSSILLKRAVGAPLVALAVIFQHSAVALAMREDSPLQSIHSIAGKKLMIEPQSGELLAYFEREGIQKNSFQLVEHSFSLDEFLAGAVDGLSVYLSSEPFYLEKSGIPFHIYSPRAAGIDFFGDNLFTSEIELKKNPGRAKAFREASLQGWRYAMDHREEIIDLITMRYSQAESREFFEFEAERIESLIRADLVELGYMNPLRWRAIADTYAELGMLQENFSFGSFLYEADPRFNPRGLYIALAIMLVIIFAGSTLSLLINRVNNRLKQTLSERETARIALAESEKKYRYIAENSSDVIWVLDLEASRFVYISPSIQRLCGFTPEETMGKPTLESIAADSRKLFACTLTQNAEKFGQGDKSTYTVEAELLRKNGSTVWSESTIRYAYAEESTRILVFGTTRDITERRLKDEAILHMAQYDGLTDLPNRVLFFESLKQALALAKRKSSSIALMFLDLDGFKPVNDTYGHAIGDLVLKEAARRLKETIRASDAIGRIGGDEFMIYIRDISSKASAVEVAEKIRTSIQSTFFVEGLDIHISSSIGLSIFPDHGTDDAILSLHADAAMYRAKNRGGNQVGIYEENLSG